MEARNAESPERRTQSFQNKTEKTTGESISKSAGSVNGEGKTQTEDDKTRYRTLLADQQSARDTLFLAEKKLAAVAAGESKLSEQIIDLYRRDYLNAKTRLAEIEEELQALSAHGHGTDDLGEIENEAKPLVTFRRPSELIARPISWLVEQIVVAAMLTVLHACDKVGKTLLAWEIALAVLKKDLLFNTFSTMQGRVVLALLDDPHDLTVQRRDALGLTDCENLRIVTPLDADLSDPMKFLAAFKKECESFGPQLIVLDALYQFAPPGKDSMNDAARMRGIMAEFNSLAEHLPAAVLLIAHDKKDGSDVAGSHVIRATAKALLHLTKPKWSKEEEEEDDGRRILTIVSKLSGESRHLLRNQGVGAWTYLGRGDSARQARTTWAQDRVLTWMREGGQGTAQEIAKAVKIRREDALVALAALDEDALVSSEVHKPEGKGRPRRVYSWSQVTGNKSPKENDGNKSPSPLEPAKIKGQSSSIFVPPAQTLAGTKIDLEKADKIKDSNDTGKFCSQTPFFSPGTKTQLNDDFYDDSRDPDTEAL